MLDIKVLGPGCRNCMRLEEVTREAVAELGVEASIVKITDFIQIAEYGPVRTPVLVVNEQIRTMGRVPDKDEVVRELMGALAE